MRAARPWMRKRPLQAGLVGMGRTLRCRSAGTQCLTASSHGRPRPGDCESVGKHKAVVQCSRVVEGMGASFMSLVDGVREVDLLQV